MSATGRPEREHRSAEREGIPASATGRPEREHRSAEREGTPLNATVAGAARPVETPFARIAADFVANPIAVFGAILFLLILTISRSST